MAYLLLQADSKKIPLADNSVSMVVTSPPYWGLREYSTGKWEDGDPACDHKKDRLKGVECSNLEGGKATVNHQQEPSYLNVCGKCGARRVDRQIGLEPTPEEYTASLVEVFREVRRVLHPSGTSFLNLGDTYSGSGMSGGVGSGTILGTQQGNRKGVDLRFGGRRPVAGIRSKNLLGIPWRVAFALQADGWWLRDAIIWSKGEVDEDLVLSGGAMPGSQQDRCTFSYEFVFQFAKSEDYFWDHEGCKSQSGALLRNVWRINTESSKFRHFAMFPRELVRRCVALATSARGVCLSCGEPWVRDVEKTRVPTRPGNVSKVYTQKDLILDPDSPYQKHNGKIVGNRDPGRHVTRTTTVGWKQGCKCPPQEPVPAVVFDPFCGASTTLLVAESLGRDSIGIDLSRSYLEQGKRRIDRPHAPVVRPVKKEDHPLFSGIE